MSYEALSTPEEVMAARKAVAKEINETFGKARQKAKTTFMPVDDFYLDSASKWIRCVGYGITAYKTAKAVSRMVGFVKRIF